MREISRHTRQSNQSLRLLVDKVKRSTNSCRPKQKPVLLIFLDSGKTTSSILAAFAVEGADAVDIADELILPTVLVNLACDSAPGLLIRTRSY